MNGNNMSGELIFGRFACACLLIPNGTRRDIHYEDRVEYIHLVLHVLPDNPNEATLIRFRKLTQKLFPVPTLAFAKSAGLSVPDYFNRPWNVMDVRRYWYYLHEAWELPGSENSYNPCATHVAFGIKPLAPGYLGGVYTGTVDATQQFLVDVYGLKPEENTPQVIHQNVICDIFDQAVDNPNQPTELRFPPSEIGLEPVAFAKKDGFFKFTLSIPSGRKPIMVDGGEGDVKVGIPSTVLPPSSEHQCDCGHECKGGNPCPQAPLMIQTGGPTPLPVEDVLFGNHFDGNPS